MKLIRFRDVDKQTRPDGRTVINFIKKDLGMDISSLQFLFVTHPANLKENLHSHEKSFEILYFFDKANYSINGEDYELDEGDLLIFEPGDIHGAIPIDNEVKLLVIQAPAITDDKKYEE